MTWCSHRKGVNEGLCAAAALPAAIKADVRLLLLLLLSRLPSPLLPSPFPFCASCAGRGETGKRCSLEVGGGGVMCVVSVVFGGGDSRAALPPQLLSQIRALYTHVPPSYCLSYITHPVQQRTRENETPTLNPKSGEGIEGQEVSLGGVLHGQGYHGERRVFFKWHFTSNLKASN